MSVMRILLAKQSHHQNGDQAARRPHIFCSISGRRRDENLDKAARLFSQCVLECAVLTDLTYLLTIQLKFVRRTFLPPVAGVMGQR